MTETTHFEQAAATWDQETRRVTLANGIAKAIAQRVPLTRDQDVLDYGCGTGLVTLALAPMVGSITGADTSAAMLHVLTAKTEATHTPLRLITLNPQEALALDGPYHLIVSSMTLHHVADIPALLCAFRQHLRPGGQVALADLDEEDGSFHEAAVPIHHRGFAREQIRTWLMAAGFGNIHLDTATTTQKEGKDYSVFLATAQRG